MIQRTIPRTLNFGDVRGLIGNSLDLHRFDVEGRPELVMARIKCTYRNGLVRTSRLHAILRHASGFCEKYVEQANGNFKRLATFRASLDEFASATL